MTQISVMQNLSKTFDKLALTKNNTGDSSCPPNVRRSKHLSRLILNLAFSYSIGMHLNNDDESKTSQISVCGTAFRDATSPTTNVVGVRARQRTPAALGAHGRSIRKSTDDVYHGVLTQLTRKIADISTAVQHLSFLGVFLCP